MNSPSQPKCPACGSGPFTESQILELQRGGFQSKPTAAARLRAAKANSKGQGKVEVKGASSSKAKASSSTKYAVSSMPASSSQEGNAQTVLTILDSSDEEDAPPPVPKWALKNKGKRPASTTDDDDDDDSDCNVAAEPPPSVKKSSQFDPETGTDTAGDLEESDDDHDKGKGSNMLLMNDFKSSTKLDALVESLNSARESDPTLKAVVFSQFTGFLDLIERVMNRERFVCVRSFGLRAELSLTLSLSSRRYVRLDGAMSQKARQKVVHKFTNSDKSCILLASLKAGGVGLNLIAATHVYLMDAWWNSAVENQAVDRLHRFGQTRPVHVTRFFIKHSIEERILAVIHISPRRRRSCLLTPLQLQLQDRKDTLIGHALGKGSSQQKQLVDDLALIFAD